MLGFSQAPRANILTQIERRGWVGEDKENETGGWWGVGGGNGRIWRKRTEDGEQESP